MFVQSAPQGYPHRAITMHDHAAMSGQIARAFGNAAFEIPEPRELLIDVISHHDAGWADFDRDPETDPATGLPFTVFATPAHLIVPTSRGSPDVNERRHPYCGLLSSMHTCGIYNGRYGLLLPGRLERIAPEHRPAVEAMLTYENLRQNRLKRILEATSQTATWVEHDRLFQSYKLMQFCDLLAIYFNTTHAAARIGQLFRHVPMSRARDATIKLTPLSAATYEVSPFPFSSETAILECRYRDIVPSGHDSKGSWRNALVRTTLTTETIELVPG